MPEPTAVAIVEDDARVRDGVRQLIDAEADFRCRGAYGNAEQALRALGGAPADLLLLDIHLPGMEGSEAARLFYERFPTMPNGMVNVIDDHRRGLPLHFHRGHGHVRQKKPPSRHLHAV